MAPSSPSTTCAERQEENSHRRVDIVGRNLLGILGTLYWPPMKILTVPLGALTKKSKPSMRFSIAPWGDYFDSYHS